MILAAGLSPAWQQILQFDALRIGEVNRAREAVWCASGKVINVAAGCAWLGREITLVSPCGGLPGQMIQSELARLPLHAEWIETARPTRVCTTLLEADGVTTELVENTAELELAAVDEFVRRVRQSATQAKLAVLTGSLPKNVPDSLFRQLLPALPPRVILDLSGPPLQDCLAFSPFLIKPNREELQATQGIPLNSDEDLVRAMWELNEQGTQWVVVSDGRRGVWVTSCKKAVRLKPPRIDLVNPIGCGDALAAGIASELELQDDVVAAVRFGMGAAAHNAEQLLPARLDPRRSRQLAEQVEIQETNF